MNYKIIEVDGVQLLLRRSHESADHSVVWSFITPTAGQNDSETFYEDEIPFRSAVAAQRFIADFSEESAALLIEDTRKIYND